MAEVSAKVKTQVAPTVNYKLWFYTFTKANATDTYDMSGEFRVVDAVLATNVATGALDPATSLTVTAVTFSVGTGATTALVIGRN